MCIRDSMDAGVLVGTRLVDSNGQAQLTTASIAVGTHSLRAVYGGSAGGSVAPSQSSAVSYSVTALSGIGFAAPVKYPAGTGAYSVAIGDFNADGKSDLAVANFDSKNVSILMGNGNGTFQSAVNYGTGKQPFSVTVGDFN